MKKNNLFVGILLVLVGFMLLFFPKRCISIVVALMGIEAVVNGIYSLVHTRKLVPDSDFQKLVFIRGTLSIVVGLLAFFLPLVVAKVVATVMMYVLGFYLLASAVILLYSSSKLRDTQIDRNNFNLEAVISIIVGIIFFIVPAEIGEVLVRIAGFIMFALGGIMLFYNWKKQAPLQGGNVEILDDISENIE